MEEEGRQGNKAMEPYLFRDVIQGLSVRAQHALSHLGTETLEQFLVLSEESFHDVPGAGTRTIREIMDKVRRCMGDRVRSGIQQNRLKLFEILFNELPMRARHVLKRMGVSTIEQLQALSEEDVLNVHNAGFKTVADIMETVQRARSEEFSAMLHVYETQLVKQQGEEAPQLHQRAVQKCMRVLQAVCTVPFGTSIEDAYELSEKKLSALGMDAFEEATDALLKAGGLCKVDGRLLTVVPSLQDALMAETIRDEDREALIGRLDGMTLQEVGQEIGLTRERVRQKVKRALGRIPFNQADCWANLFQAYDWEDGVLAVCFHLDDRMERYLQLRYRKGSKELDGLLQDAQIPVAMRRAVERYLNRDNLEVDGQYIAGDRASILEFILREYCQEETAYQELREKIDRFLMLVDREDLDGLYPDGSLQNHLADSHMVLWQHKKIFRYYDVDAVDIGQLIEDIHLADLHDVEISTQFFIIRYPDVMREYDIRNADELHNLLKKCRDDITGIPLKMERMPHLLIGNGDRDKQVMELFHQEAPISVDDLADIYEEEYGVLARTVKATYFPLIAEYRQGNMLTLDVMPLTENELMVLRRFLTKKLYRITEVERLFQQYAPKGINQLNNFNLKSLGYHLSSYVVIRDDVEDLAAYVRQLFQESDLVDMDEQDDELKLVGVVNNELYNLKKDYEILEYEPWKFIHIRRLEEHGIHKQDFADYAQAVAVFVGARYFTMTSLRAAGFKHPLDELGFKDFFYAQVLHWNGRFCAYRMGGRILLRATQKQFDNGDFLKALIREQGSMEINDLQNLLAEDYGMLDASNYMYRYIEAAVNKGMYYDKIINKLYNNYEEYFQEV